MAPLMPYLFNSPEMHLWHYAKELPTERFHGVNFGLTLAVWDYLFGTDYQPHHAADLALGFKGVEGVLGQQLYGVVGLRRSAAGGDILPEESVVW